MSEWIDLYPPDDSGRPPEAGDGGDDRDKSSVRHANPVKMAIDDTLDLHGYRLQEALDATGTFIEQSVEAGYRKVLVIHGKGPDGQGVLRREVRTYLEQHPLTGTIGYGRGSEGGRGALWVMLREKQSTESALDGHRSR